MGAVSVFLKIELWVYGIWRVAAGMTGPVAHGPAPSAQQTKTKRGAGAPAENPDGA